jgi:Tol biopolymer transport system component
MRWPKVIAITAVAWILTFAAFAAEELAYLYGTVIDGNNNPVARAIVRIGDRTFTTRHDGVYYFDGLRPGHHEVSVMAQGKTLTQPVELQAGRYAEQTLVFKQVGPVLRFANVKGGPNEIIPNVGINSYASVSRKDGTLAVEVLARDTLRFDIWHLDRAGVKLGVLVSSEDDDENPRWSPDGSKIVFHRLRRDRGYEVWMKDLVSGKLEFVDSGLTPAWSLDGRGLVYAKKLDGNWDIHKKDLITGTVTRLTTNTAGDQYPYWAKVGGEERILFASARSGIYEIWSMAPDGGDQRQLSTCGLRTGKRMVGPVSSAEGRLIAFWEIDYENDHSIWVMNSDGSNPREWFKRAANPEWDVLAPGGRTIYFDSKITGRAQIWRGTVTEK